MLGKRKRGEMRMGFTKHGAPTHENQMKGRLDDSLGRREEEREKETTHKAVRVLRQFSIIDSVCARCIASSVGSRNVSMISQHVYCISIDVFNLGLTQTSLKSCPLLANK